MAPDDKETKEKPLGKLPSRVERALAQAREAVKADRQRKEGRWLAIIPVGIGAILMLLLMPRATVPDAVPVPVANARVLRDIARTDDARAEAAERERLPSDILAVGTAVRLVNGGEARGLDEAGFADARRQLDGALRDLARRKDAGDDLLRLRALQTRRFLDALARWEASGETTEDFLDLAASFVLRANDAGWLDGRRVLVGEDERRAMFKTVWNALTARESSPDFALALDESRALYAFYFAHPRVPELHRLALEDQRRRADTPEECARAHAEEARQTELWRADKIKRFGAIDPSYPTAYALGVSYYHAGRFELAADAFAAFVAKNPDGPYALRARNHLKAALLVGGGSR